jgi:hypothetical protein
MTSGNVRASETADLFPVRDGGDHGRLRSVRALPPDGDAHGGGHLALGQAAALADLGEAVGADLTEQSVLAGLDLCGADGGDVLVADVRPVVVAHGVPPLGFLFGPFLEVVEYWCSECGIEQIPHERNLARFPGPPGLNRSTPC